MRSARPVRLHRLRNQVRGVWPDHNPVRRTSDRAEAAVLATLLAVFLIAAPLAAMAAGRWAAAAGARAERASHSRYQVRAVVVEDSRYQGYGYGTPLVRAEWTTRDGATHTGEVAAPPGARRGTTMRIWTDPAGHPTGPPLQPGAVTSPAALATVAAPFVVALALVSLAMIAHQVLERRRLAAWAADWRATGPRWTHQR